jgi:rhamnose transport system permease protein
MGGERRVEAAVAGALVALWTLLALRAPAFFQPANLLDMLLAALPVLVVAAGATLVILLGEIDISVGSVFAICSVAAGVLAVAGVPLPLVAVLTPAIGALLGSINGLLVGLVGLPSIVVTLAAMVTLRDGLRWVTQGAWVEGLPADFQWLGFGQRLFPWMVMLLAALNVGGLHLLLTSRRAGRMIYAVGSNAEAARLAGIDPRLVRMWTFVAAGALTGIGALLNTVRFSQVPPNTGLGLEMQVIAAVVVGGTAITGGRGTLLGTVLGVTLLSTAGPALTFLGASAFWERALQGAIILTAVGAEAVRAVTRVRRPRERVSA